MLLVAGRICIEPIGLPRFPIHRLFFTRVLLDRKRSAFQGYDGATVFMAVDWKTGLDADLPGHKKHADVNETKETIEVMVVENKKE